MSLLSSSRSTDRLGEAVHLSRAASAKGVLERIFSFIFDGLIYPQIWEDPVVDLQALELRPDSRLAAIASGGCNVLAYLTADPAEIMAVDLNRAHVALTKLKLAAVRHLPSHSAFFRFFGTAAEEANVGAYHSYLRPRLDRPTRDYWEGRDFLGRRRINFFAGDLYRIGLLGRFIGLAHFVARLYGTDPGKIMQAATIEEQQDYFRTAIAPIFDKRLVRWAASKPLSLYGLGIPPAQFEALAAAGDGDMAAVLKRRLERLACGFPVSDNYFAWQAFGRRYPTEPAGPLPPYLQRQHFADIRARAERVTVVNRSFTEHLETEAASCLDAYVLLDAQDWMSDAQLNALWTQITRTARPGARVIFRTAAEPSLLPGRLAESLLACWTYDAERSRRLGALDRSSIYGGFHRYVFRG